MTDRKPDWYLCAWCKHGLIKSIPEKCPVCGAELTEQVGGTFDADSLRQIATERDNKGEA